MSLTSIPRRAFEWDELSSCSNCLVIGPTLSTTRSLILQSIAVRLNAEHVTFLSAREQELRQWSNLDCKVQDMHHPDVMRRLLDWQEQLPMNETRAIFL